PSRTSLRPRPCSRQPRRAPTSLASTSIPRINTPAGRSRRPTLILLCERGGAMLLHHRTGRLFLSTFMLMAAAARPARTGAPGNLELVQTMPVRGTPDRLDHLATDNKHGRLFVANLSNNSLDIVDLQVGKLVKQICQKKNPEDRLRP